MEHAAEDQEKSRELLRVALEEVMGSKIFTISELADQADLLSKPLSDHAGT